jgi:hypothetical protein
MLGIGLADGLGLGEGVLLTAGLGDGLGETLPSIWLGDGTPETLARDGILPDALEVSEARAADVAACMLGDRANL